MTRVLLSTCAALSGIQPQPDFDPTEPDAEAWTKAIAEAVRCGLLEQVGVDCDGKPIYQRTALDRAVEEMITRAKEAGTHE